MQNEIILVLGFILLFNFVTISPAGNENPFIINSEGAKHYVLTQQVSVFDASEQFSNIIFLKYDDPWNQQESIFVISITLLIFVFMTLLIVNSRYNVVTTRFSQTQSTLYGFYNLQNNFNKIYLASSTHFKLSSFKLSKKKLFIAFLFTVFIFSSSPWVSAGVGDVIDVTDTLDVSDAVNIPSLIPPLIVSDTLNVSDNANIPGLISPLIEQDSLQVSENANIPDLILPLIETDILEISDSFNIPQLIAPIFTIDIIEIIEQIIPPPPIGDIDNDGIPDASDNCPNISNANQNNLDSDSTGDACDSETLITSNTILTNSTSLGGDLVVETGVILTINPGVTLNVDFLNHKALVKSGGGIEIKSGGKIT